MARNRRGAKSAGEEKIEMISSSLGSVSEIHTALAKYNTQLPPDWVVDVAGPDLRLNSEMAATDTRRVIYTKMFKYGLRLPLDPLMANLLTHFNLNLAQLSPNAFCCVYAFLELCRLLAVGSPTLALFQSLFQLYSRKGVLGIGPRYFDELLKPFTWKLMHIESSVEGWKDNFFVITLPDNLWRSGFNRDITDGSWNRRQPLSAEDQASQDILLKLDFSVNTPKLARGIALDKCTVGKCYSVAFSLSQANTNADIISILQFLIPIGNQIVFGGEKNDCGSRQKEIT